MIMAIKISGKCLLLYYGGKTIRTLAILVPDIVQFAAVSLGTYLNTSVGAIAFIGRDIHKKQVRFSNMISIKHDSV